MDLIIYHNNCPDGFTAAYVAKMKYPEAELMPRDHGLEPPYAEVTGKDVLVVDFSWRTKEQNQRMASLAKSFQILDHHKTAQAELEGEPYAIFDMSRSGAGLAWDYLFGHNQPGLPSATYIGDANNISVELRPWWVSYVEDRDLWRFKLWKSEEVNDFIMTFPYTMEGWKAMTSADPLYAATAGENVRLQVTKYVREACKQAQLGTYRLPMRKVAYSVLVVNVPYLNTSEVGNELSKTADVGLGWFERADGMIQVSLRSKGEIDVSEIAKQFNGGGHKNAAGFQVTLSEGRRIIDSILGR